MKRIIKLFSLFIIFTAALTFGVISNEQKTSALSITSAYQLLTNVSVDSSRNVTSGSVTHTVFGVSWYPGSACVDSSGNQICEMAITNYEGVQGEWFCNTHGNPTTPFGTAIASIDIVAAWPSGDWEYYTIEITPIDTTNFQKVKGTLARQSASLFEGRANVSEETMLLDTSWQNTGTTILGPTTIKCPSEGCKVNFELSLRRTQGVGSPQYSIYRGTSPSAINYYTAISLNSSLKATVPETIKPGNTVCYDIVFVTNSISGTTATTGVCVTAKDYNKFEARAKADTPEDAPEKSTAHLDTDWQVADKYEEKVIKCPEEGCPVNYYLALKRDLGDEEPKYEIYRSDDKSNLLKERTSNQLTITAYDTTTRVPSLYETNIEETVYADYEHNTSQTVCYSIRAQVDEYTDTWATETTCIIAEPYSRYEGIASAAGTDLNITTDWQNKDTHVQKTIKCDDSGCDVDFSLGIRRTKGSETTAYYFKKGEESVENLKDFETGTTAEDGSAIVKKYTERMEPGDIMCYGVVFQPFEEKDDWATESVCVTIEEEPRIYSGCLGEIDGTTMLDIAVRAKRNGTSTYTEWAKEVYVKPGDQVEYCVDYNPSLYQGAYGYKFRYYDYAGNCATPKSKKYLGQDLGLTNSIAVLRDSNKNSDATFTSSTTVVSESFTGGNRSFQQNFHFYTGNDANGTIYAKNVGYVIDEKAVTTDKTPTSTATTDSITCAADKSCATISTDSRETEPVHTYVPYNFTNTISTTSGRVNGIVYAGGSESVGYVVGTRPKYNSVTDGTYATRVENATVTISIYTSDYPPNHPKHSKYSGKKLGTIKKEGITLNSEESATGAEASTDPDAFKISIPDVPAGTYVCAQASVYPATSGPDDNWSDPEGGHDRAEGNSICYIVAKKPSLAVWGGDVYSDKDITTSIHKKLHLVNNETNGTYHVASTDYINSYTFGSWGELGIISNGTVIGMGSGASMGDVWGDPTSNECARVPLSFANAVVTTLGKATCTPNTGSLNKSSMYLTELDDNTIISKFIYEKDNNVSTYKYDQFNSFDVVISEDMNKGNNTYYYKKLDNLTIGAGIDHELDKDVDQAIHVPRGTVQIIHATGTITIQNDLKYEDADGDGFSKFSDIPKLIIYAEERIDILCDVAEIDAVLVSPRVTTCSDGELAAGATIKENVKYDKEKCGLTPENLATVDSEEISAEEKEAYAQILEYIDSDPSIYNVICDTPEANNQQAQLKITGAVITNRLVANRTYGAGTGMSSATPAEILNFDPSLYRLEVHPDTPDTDLTTTYFRELPPRY